MNLRKDKKIVDLVNSYSDWWNKGFDIPTMSNKLYPYTKMFEPIKVNKLTIKNRLVMAPMGNLQMAEETGRPNQKMLKYFEERAKGGVGLITSGLIPISYGIDKSLLEKGNLSYFPRIDRTRTVFSGWRDLAVMCHSHGAKFFIQLTPGLGRVGNPQVLFNFHSLPVSSSWNKNWYMDAMPCKRLSEHQCKKIIKNAGQASADSKACGIDGVYLHGHEGYLLEQMTNAAFNRRVLGRYSNKERFGIDMVKEIRRRVGKDYPIMYRIDLTLALNETYGERMNKQKPYQKFRKGRNIFETFKYMEHLVEAGVDMFDVDMGCYDNWWLPHPPSSMPSGCFVSLAEMAKDYFKKNNIISNAGVEVPIVAVGKLGYPDLAEKILRDGKCDMVMLGRPLLSDPDWVNKAYKGSTDEIIPCIGCQEGCVNEFVEGGHVQCAVNPKTGFEDEFTSEIQKATKIKNVAVVGSGPAGITAVEVLLKRGHNVTLFEKDSKIGGQMIPGSKSIIKYEVKNYVTYLENSVKKLLKNPRFTFKLNTKFISKEHENEFDSILVATGASPLKIPFKGIDKKHVFDANDVFNDQSLLDKYKNIAVIGGGVVGAEMAYTISYEMNKTTFVVEMGTHIMDKTCTANRGHIIHYLEENKVELFTMTKLKSIEEDHIIVEKNKGKNIPNPYNTWNPILPESVENPLAKKIGIKYVEEKIKCDAVVIATGTVSNNSLYFKLVKEHAAPEINYVGDAIKGGKVHDATRTAFRKALTI